ncbi:MAG TPA: hypothetical protein VFI15_08630 [Candidatus Limnocylindrales bacterium]|nr:hypothetical protein [Candidatus Limnocylindrales bacterium]
MAIAGLSLDVRSGGLLVISGSFGVIALGVLAAAFVLARASFLGPAVLVLELAYLQHVLLAGPPTVVEVAVVSLAALLAGELGQWSIDNRTVRIEAGQLQSGRLRAILGLLVVSGLAVAAVAFGAVAPVVAGPAVAIVAVPAAVAAVAIVSLAATRAARP